MKAVLVDMVDVLKKHGVDIDLDTAKLTVGPFGKIEFRCCILNDEYKKLREQQVYRDNTGILW